jgi:hypothetical protein
MRLFFVILLFGCSIASAHPNELIIASQFIVAPSVSGVQLSICRAGKCEEFGNFSWDEWEEFRGILIENKNQIISRPFQRSGRRAETLASLATILTSSIGVFYLQDVPYARVVGGIILAVPVCYFLLTAMRNRPLKKTRNIVIEDFLEIGPELTEVRTIQIPHEMTNEFIELLDRNLPR